MPAPPPPAPPPSKPPPILPHTLLGRLKHWCHVQPSKRALTFVDDKGKEVASLTYAETHARALSIADGLLSPPSSRSKTTSLLSTPLQKGDCVILVFLPSLDFTVAFLACLIAGLIPVPVFPPDPRRLNKDLHMFTSIQASSGAKVALTHVPYNHLKKVSQLVSFFKGKEGGGEGGKEGWPETLTWVAIEGLKKRGGSERGREEEAEEGATCFLQYTSGSTSEPKGVEISHGNLTHNLKIISEELRTDTGTVEVSWLPQYHDMGLIGSYLGLLYCGGSGYYASPLSFIRRPLLWLELLSKYQATHTQAPNFAYALAAKKYRALPDPKPSFDLSSLRHMVNAAEPVDGPTLASFSSCFLFSSPSSSSASSSRKEGGKEGVIFPTYGLAEHTVFVCGGGRQRLWVEKNSLEGGGEEGGEGVPVAAVVPTPPHAPGSRELVGCGVPRNDVNLLIVDPSLLRSLPPGHVGEIWVDSPSKAKGYWRHPQETQDMFRACVSPSPRATGDKEEGGGEEGKEDEANPREYLRTGDLGFLYNEELFVCGRLKDLLIIRGKNYYPQDIEKAAESVDTNLVRPGCSAAFSVPPSSLPSSLSSSSTTNTTTDLLILLLELRSPPSSPPSSSVYPSLARRVLTHLSSSEGVLLSVLLFFPPHTIPKTTSGKVARAWARKAFLHRSLPPALHTWERTGGREEEAGLPVEEDEEGREGRGEEAVLRRIEVLIRKAMGGEGGQEGGREGEEGGGNGVGTHEEQQQQQQPQQQPQQQQDEKERQQAETPFSSSSLPPPLPPSLPLHRLPLQLLGQDSLTLAQLKARIETEFCPPSLAPPPRPPPPSSSLPSLVPAAAAAEGGMEGEGGREGWLPDEYFFREETTGGHVAAMVWAVMEGGKEGGREGGGGMGPEEAWEVYEDWCRREAEGGREGGEGGVMEVEMVMKARRREGGRRGWKEWVVQISPCCLLLPWCRP